MENNDNNNLKCDEVKWNEVRTANHTESPQSGSSRTTPRQTSQLPIEAFGKFPSWYVHTFEWARLSRNQMAVLGVLIIQGHNKTRHCWPSRKTISMLSGVNEKSVSAATEVLKEMALIKKWRKGFRVLYKVLVDPPDYLRETGINWDTKQDKKPKTPDSYRKDMKSGKFMSKKIGNNSVQETDTEVSEQRGHGFKSGS